MKKCICGEPAILYRSYEGRGYCRKHFIKYVERKVKRTLGKYNLIKYGDKVAVAVSGGKDSMFMLYMIHKIFKNVKRISYFVISVNEGIKNYRDRSLKIVKDFCKKEGIEFVEISFSEEFSLTIDEIFKGLKEGSEKICTWCGVLKRYLINKKAREMDATKVAIGHTLDDEAESIIMNFVRGDLDRFLRLGPCPALSQTKSFVPRIKPIREITTEEVKLYNKLRSIPYYNRRCPYATDNVRLDVQRVLNELEKKYPDVKYQIVRFYDTLRPILTKAIEISNEFKKCKRCGEVTSREICKVCELLNKLRTR